MTHQDSDYSSCTDACLSGWQLDQYELGALSGRERQRVKEHIELCEACAQRLAERRQDAEEMIAMPGFDALLAKLSQQPLEPSAQGVQPMPDLQRNAEGAAPATDAAAASPSDPRPKASGPLGRGVWRWLGWGSLSSLSAVAVAAALLVIQAPDALLWLPETSPEPAHRSVWLAKTNHRSPRRQKPTARPQAPKRVAKSMRPVFGVVHFHKGKKYSQWTKEREQLQPGDLIQFAYQLPKAMHVMIASVNEQGEISVFFPLGGRRSAQLSPGAGTLPHEGSLELDDYLGKERILIALSPKPIAYQALKAAIQKAFLKAHRDLAKMAPIRGPWHCHSLLIRKTKTRPGERKGAL